MNHCCLKSATLSNQCSTTSTATYIVREGDPIDAVFLITKALYGLVQAIMGQELTLDMLRSLKNFSTLEENFLNGF